MEKYFKYLIIGSFISFAISFLAFTQENIGLTNYALGSFLSLFGATFILGARHTYKTKQMIYSTGSIQGQHLLPGSKRYKIVIALFLIIGLGILGLGLNFILSEPLTGKYFLRKE